MLLSVIVVSYNTKTLTVQTLYSLEKEVLESPILQGETEIFVVDNNSTDDSVAAITDFAKKTKLKLYLLKNKENVGFARANNQAIEKSEGKYLFLLNSDTIVEKNAVRQMVEVLSSSTDSSTAVLSTAHNQLDHLGVLAATLQNPDGTLQKQGGSLPTLVSLFFHMTLLDDLPVLGKYLPSTQHTGSFHSPTKNSLLTSMGWVAGTALMIKREVVEEIGLLDEHIFMYGEDVEWCMRAQAHHWDVAIHNTAMITHLQSQSAGKERALRGELLGYLYIWSKHKPFWQIAVARTLLLYGCFIRCTIFSLMGEMAKANIYYRIMKTIAKASI